MGRCAGEDRGEDELVDEHGDDPGADDEGGIEPRVADAAGHESQAAPDYGEGERQQREDEQGDHRPIVPGDRGDAADQQGAEADRIGHAQRQRPEKKLQPVKPALE